MVEPQATTHWHTAQTALEQPEKEISEEKLLQCCTGFSPEPDSSDGQPAGPPWYQDDGRPGRDPYSRSYIPEKEISEEKLLQCCTGFSPEPRKRKSCQKLQEKLTDETLTR